MVQFSVSYGSLLGLVLGVSFRGPAVGLGSGLLGFIFTARQHSLLC